MNLKDLLEILRNASEIIALIFGAGWAWFKIWQYRQLKDWIELDLDSHLYKLQNPVDAERPTWNREGDRITKKENCTHAIEILLHFTNKSARRLRLYNIQVGINTMRAPNDTLFDGGDGHVHLTRVFTSGNLVPEMPVKDIPIELSSHFYIEPTVRQTISFCTFITQPRDLVQVFAQFSLAGKRIFPKVTRSPNGLYPHTAARTYRLEDFEKPVLRKVPQDE